MAEGRVRNEGGGFGLVLKMEYYITDHQGNTRVSFEDNNGTVALRQENSYYAFGMQMAGGYIPGSNLNKKLYNAGSEWQDDIEGLADYYSTFFREYDPIIGRFNGADPMAVATDEITTYAYANNNPVMMNDPLGDVSKAEFQNAIAALLANGGGTYHFSTGTFEFGQASALKNAAESILGMSLSDFSNEGGIGGGGDDTTPLDRLIETARKYMQIMKAASQGDFNGLGLNRIKYTGNNEERFGSDILKIAQVKAGALVIALLETSGFKYNIDDDVKSVFDSYTRENLSFSGVNTNYYSGGGVTELADDVSTESYLVLGHEMFHALDKMSVISRVHNVDETNYAWDYDNDHSTSAYREMRAVTFENILRKQYNAGERFKYSGIGINFTSNTINLRAALMPLIFGAGF